MTIRVHGVRETVRRLEQLGADVTDMKTVMAAAGEIVLTDAEPRTPKRTGTLVGTLRAAKSKNSVKIRAGGRAAHYARFVNNGTIHAAATRFLDDAAEATKDQVLTTVQTGLKDILDHYR